MNLFQLLSIIGLGGTILAVGLHFVAMRPRRLAPSAKEPRDVLRLTRWERLVHWALLLTFLTLLVTSFYPALGGQRMSGYLLMLHTSAGAAFAVSLVAMMITWAVAARLEKYDGEWLRRRGCVSEGPDGIPAGRFDAAEKIYFWAVGILGTTTLLSMMLSMVPVFGTYGQAVLYEVHRYAALLVVMATTVHAYRTTLAKPGTFGALLGGRVSAKWAKYHHAIWWQQRSRGDAGRD
jgi:formate dehydrogenase subunit gamma